MNKFDFDRCSCFDGWKIELGAMWQSSENVRCILCRCLASRLLPAILHLRLPLHRRGNTGQGTPDWIAGNGSDLRSSINNCFWKKKTSYIGWNTQAHSTSSRLPGRSTRTIRFNFQTPSTTSDPWSVISQKFKAIVEKSEFSTKRKSAHPF